MFAQTKWGYLVLIPINNVTKKWEHWLENQSWLLHFKHVNSSYKPIWATWHNVRSFYVNLIVKDLRTLCGWLIDIKRDINNRGIVYGMLVEVQRATFPICKRNRPWNSPRNMFEANITVCYWCKIRNGKLLLTGILISVLSRRASTFERKTRAGTIRVCATHHFSPLSLKRSGLSSFKCFWAQGHHVETARKTNMKTLWF